MRDTFTGTHDECTFIEALHAISLAVYQAPHATDGNGPDPMGLLIFFSALPLGLLLLLHSRALAWYLRRRRNASILSGKHDPATHAVPAALFVGCMLIWFR